MGKPKIIPLFEHWANDELSQECQNLFWSIYGIASKKGKTSDREIIKRDKETSKDMIRFQIDILNEKKYIICDSEFVIWEKHYEGGYFKTNITIDEEFEERSFYFLERLKKELPMLPNEKRIWTMINRSKWGSSLNIKKIQDFTWLTVGQIHSGINGLKNKKYATETIIDPENKKYATLLVSDWYKDKFDEILKDFN